VDIVCAEPDITLKELATALSETERVQVKLSSLQRALGRTLDRAPGHRRGHERSGIRHWHRNTIGPRTRTRHRCHPR